jgi:ATP synthase B/B' subunit
MVFSNSMGVWQSREEGAAIIAAMREQAQAEARRITEAARAHIEADRLRAFSSLRAEIGTLSVQLAGKIVGESLAAVRGRWPLMLHTGWVVVRNHVVDQTFDVS